MLMTMRLDILGVTQHVERRGNARSVGGKM